jgi:GDPmannose 4,6-dehydratase
MKAIIFGANGQDGFYLEKLLLQEKIETTSVSRDGNDYVVKGNIVDRMFVESLIRSIQPDYIFNLAANSSTHHDHLFENHATISTGTLNILDSAWKHSKGSKIFLCGSGLQFVNHGQGIKESDAFEARDAYSIARIQSVYAARYFRTLGLNIYIGYLFNHDSPLRSPRHVNQKIAQTAKRISLGSSEYLELGNLGVEKEFSFAGDIVEAIWRLVNNENDIFEAVIGSGKAYSIKYWVELCFNCYGLSWGDHIVMKEGFRPEYAVLVSQPETIFSLGWRPKIGIEQLSKMFCEGI